MSMDKLTAKDIMTSSVISFTEDTHLKDAIQTLLSAGISGAPVVVQDGRLTGIITEEDMIGLLGEHGFDYPNVSIGQIRSLGTTLIVRNVSSVSPDAGLSEIVKAMIIRKVKRLPVVDQDGKVVGIVSRRDVLRAMAQNQ